MLIQVDAAQLEWRVAVELSKDKIGLTEILNQEDIHTNNKIAFNLPDRLTSKTYLFRTIYRGSGWSFAHDPNFMHVSSSPAYWDNVNEKFYNKYYGLDQIHKQWAERVVQGLSIISPLGREWPIKMGVDKKGNIFIPWTILTNYPVQGTGADIMSIARVSFFKRIKQLKLTILMISSVHDSIVVDTPEDPLIIKQLFLDVFKDLQSNIKAIWGYDWKVPLTCEVKAGNNLKDMEKI